MNIEELQADIDLFSGDLAPDPGSPLANIVEAARLVADPNIEAAANGLLGYEIRAVLRHNWTEEGIDHIERAIAQRAVAAALTPGDTDPGFPSYDGMNT